VAKKPSRTWVCTGIPDGSHEPFDNFGPDCAQCGASQADVLKGKSPAPTSAGAGRAGKTALIGGAIAAVLLLGGGTLLFSARIPGVCNALGSCEQWQTAVNQAQQQAKSAVNTAANAQSVAELEGAQAKLTQALSQLRSIPTNAKVYGQARNLLKGFQENLTQLETRLAAETKAQTQLSQAQSAAQAAGKQSQAAQSRETLVAAREKWEQVLQLLKGIPAKSLVAKQASSQAQKYSQELAALDQKIADLDAAAIASTPTVAEPEPTGGGRGYYAPPPPLWSAPNSNPNIPPLW
jgi:hypothetical protein